MSKRRHNLRPELEPIEQRALLSGGIASSAVAGAIGSPAIAKVVPLDGTLRGHYQVNSLIPDAGLTYDTNGSGHVNRVGHTSVSGTLHSIGFIAIGHAQGDLLLSSSRGTITLQLTGADQHGGPKGLPDAFSFTVTGGTGKYRNLKDAGTATLVTTPAAANPDAHLHGKFTLVLKSYPIPA